MRKMVLNFKSFSMVVNRFKYIAFLISYCILIFRYYFVQ